MKKDAQISVVGLWPAYSFGAKACPAFRKEINVLQSSSLFEVNSKGKSFSLSTSVQSLISSCASFIY